MPTFCNQCGEEVDSYPYEENCYRDGDECGCECEGSGGSADSFQAREAIDHVDSLPLHLLHDMRVDVRRQVSCEFEGTRGIMTAYDACANLGFGARCDHHGDVTCDGEIVFSRLELWRDESAHAYSRSLAALDYLKTSDVLSVGMAAGHHIHVGARNAVTGRGLSPNNLVSLYSVFAHCEDLLYRLAAAGWSQHRSEVDGSYSNPMFKLHAGQRRTPRTVGNRLLEGDRYQGLNVTPYLNAVQGCRCGAYRFGQWDECECHDERHTVEWRLWNAAVSARKVRAYIAISAVLTDYASQVDVRDVTGLDENEFSSTRTVDEESLSRQLDYLVSRPGFTKRDRADIYWLVSISPGMGSLAREFASARGNASSSSPSLAHA